jgi:preprotein translocase subunit SecA
MTYPVEFMIDMVFQAAKQNGEWAAQQLAAWANHRYELGWTPETVSKMSGNDLFSALMKASEEWWGGKLDAMIDKAIAEHPSPDDLAKWAMERIGGRETKGEDLKDPARRRTVLLEKGRNLLRAELTQLERYVLLQILDQAWKDHLYAMDQLKDSVSLLGYAEKDPRIEYKREGAAQFNEMQSAVRDRVTELIFRARLTPTTEVRNVYSEQEAQHEVAESSGVAPAEASAEQREALAAAEQAGTGGGPQSRKARRAASAEPEPVAAKKPQYKERRHRSR